MKNTTFAGILANLVSTMAALDFKTIKTFKNGGVFKAV